MTDEKYVVRVENGYVKLFDLEDNFKRYICGNAVRCEVTGSKIRVTTRTGKIMAYRVEELSKR